MNSKGYFEQVATQWDSMRADFFDEALRDKALSQAALHRSMTAADIGAGTGFITEGLLQRGLKVIAIDQSPEMLHILSDKFADKGTVICRQGEAESLPLADGEVDAVFANMYLHHVEDPLATIREMARALKPGGKLVISDLDSHHFAFLLSEHHDRWPGFSRDDVTAWLKETSFGDITVTCAGENCCATSICGDSHARISIFLATAVKR